MFICGLGNLDGLKSDLLFLWRERVGFGFGFGMRIVITIMSSLIYGEEVKVWVL